MPYVIVEGDLEGKEESNRFITSVSGLKASEVNELINFNPSSKRDNYTLNFQQHPCVILNALEVLGFQVISSTCKQGSTVIWTMRKEFEK